MANQSQGTSTLPGLPGSSGLEAHEAPSLDRFDAFNHEAIPSAESLLTLEQIAYAEQIIEAITARGIYREDVRLVVEESPEHGRRVVAFDASPNGTHVVSYNGIAEQREANPNLGFAEVNGDLVDLLSGTTDAAYRAMIADAKARKVSPLPDSYPLSQQNRQPHTWTMLTGEELAFGRIRVRTYAGSGVGGTVFSVNNEDPALRIRYAAVVAQL